MVTKQLLKLLEKVVLKKRPRKRTSTQKNVKNIKQTNNTISSSSGNTAIQPAVFTYPSRSSEMINIALMDKNKEIENMKNKELEEVKKNVSELQKYKLDEPSRILGLTSSIITPMLTYVRDEGRELGGGRIEEIDKDVDYIGRKVQHIEHELRKRIADYERDRSGFVRQEDLRKDDPGEGSGEKEGNFSDIKEQFESFLNNIGKQEMYDILIEFDKSSNFLKEQGLVKKRKLKEGEKLREGEKKEDDSIYYTLGGFKDPLTGKPFTNEGMRNFMFNMNENPAFVSFLKKNGVIG